jgi:hypothetical protein
MARVGLLIAVLALGGCSPGPWTGWVYPDHHDLSQQVSLGEFASLNDCRKATLGFLQNSPTPENGAYQCGLGCRWDAGKGSNVCLKTVR